MCLMCVLKYCIYAILHKQHTELRIIVPFGTAILVSEMVE